MGKLTSLVVLHFLVAHLTLMAQNMPALLFPTWEFPIQNCQEGLLIGNGEAGAMIWGSTDTLKITISLAGNWDRRGGAKELEGITYHKIVNALGQPKPKQIIDSLFTRINTSKPSLPSRPFQLGVADVFIPIAKGYKIISCTLGENGQALLSVTSSKGKSTRASLAWTKANTSLELVDHQRVCRYENIKAVTLN